MYSSIIPILAWGLVLAICALAWIKGGRPERLGIVFVLVAALVAMAIHRFASEEWKPLLLLVDEALLAMGFLFLALRYTSVWLGGAMILQAVQFSLHAYYLVADRAHDRLYSTINNIDTLGVLACILVGALMSARNRAASGK
ncbi:MULTISPECIES: hypothetical protein [unclassified Caulobacter]|uniref:hypothetical protein n=1 Tax=unclassified Caulobacter TaxID=2648921 RepID=UPI000D3B848E|nr:MULTISPECIES: hypothetical protein [unclassified Caulobacter]PTS82994.1 hypothetical protein DBR21_16905 [Caulobacter sp. HMWF009]PTT10763.1 hypothetical protein DBR10_04530 [Caulobacter sp. HMWF025]PTT79870.1 hypothetical protein DBR41_20920 [Pseudomonas sp. HMWF010]